MKAEHKSACFVVIIRRYVAQDPNFLLETTRKYKEEFHRRDDYIDHDIVPEEQVEKDLDFDQTFDSDTGFL